MDSNCAIAGLALLLAGVITSLIATLLKKPRVVNVVLGIASILAFLGIIVVAMGFGDSFQNIEVFLKGGC
jgi:hypothetical protein